MEPALEAILRELQTVRQELHDLKRLIYSDQQSIELLLRRRGIRTVKYAPTEHCVLPAGSSDETEAVFYALMKKYSFRIFLRDLLQYTQTPDPEVLTRYCSARVAQQYLKILLDRNILCQTSPANYVFTSGSAPRFGETLEWFVAQVLRTEFGAITSWGLRLKHADVGGDYDVLASVEGSFLYLEVKSSPPKHIESPEIQGFLDRVGNLQPELAIFLEDTHLRMQDKVVPMFTEELQRRDEVAASQEELVQRLHNEIFAIQPNVLIMNTRPGLISNLGFGLKHFLMFGRSSRFSGLSKR